LTWLVEKAKNQAMIRAHTLAAICALTACGKSKGVPDDQLGGLVVAAQPPAKVDVDTAVKDPAELSRALASTHAMVLAAIGPHAATVDTKTVVEEGGKPISELSDHATLEAGATAGSFKALYTNTADYGREAIFVGGKLYLRPRYQHWHGRAPETPEEPSQIRDQYFAAIAATWDLLSPAAELTDRGPIQFEGRAGRKIEVKLSPTPREPATETLTQRKWREGRSVQTLMGEVILDADKGVPLSVKLQGSIAFSRDGRQFVMRLGLDASIASIGSVAAIAAPPDGEVVATPERLGEVDERDFLLHGIAPSTRAKSDGSAAAPIVPDSKKPPDDPEKKKQKKPEKPAKGPQP
jgi:hypothetical protein